MKRRFWLLDTALCIFLLLCTILSFFGLQRSDSGQGFAVFSSIFSLILGGLTLFFGAILPDRDLHLSDNQKKATKALLFVSALAGDTGAKARSLQASQHMNTPFRRSYNPLILYLFALMHTFCCVMNIIYSPSLLYQLCCFGILFSSWALVAGGLGYLIAEAREQGDYSLVKKARNGIIGTTVVLVVIVLFAFWVER